MRILGNGSFIRRIFLGDPVNGYKPVTSPDLYRDPITGSVVVINNEHDSVHDGVHFFLDHDIDMLANGEHYFAFETDGCNPHVLFAIDFCLLPVRVEAWEGIESYTGGTEIVLENNNRSYPSNSHSTFKHSVTPTIGAGVKYLNRRIGGGNLPSTRTGAASREANERILKESTIYLVKITNLANAANSVNYSISLYETH